MVHFKHLTEGSSVPENFSEGIILYCNVICPYVHRIYLVLNAKKLPYTSVYIDIWNKPEWYVQKSPTTKVPALKVPEQQDPLIESLVIAEYLDEKYPEISLHSKNVLQKANDRILIERFSGVLNSISKIIYPKYRNYQKIKDVGKVADEMFTGLDVFEHELRKRGSPYFGGENPGMVDYMIWPWMEKTLFLNKIDAKYELNGDQFSSLISWRNLMTKNDAVKACALSSELSEEFYQRMESKTPFMDLLDDASEQRERIRPKF